MSNKSIIIYREWLSLIKGLSEADQAKLWNLILEEDYRDSEISNSLKGIFNFIKLKIDENNQKYQSIIERNRINGANGGRPKNPNKPKKPSGLFGNPAKPRETLNDQYIINNGNKELEISNSSFNSKQNINIELEKKENIPTKAFLQKKENSSKSETVVSSTQKFSADFQRLLDDHQKLTVEKYSAIRKTGASHEQIVEWLQDFDEFWQHYTPIRSTDGRCVGRGDKIGCRVKYLRILWAGELQEKIMEGLKNYLEFCQKGNQLTLAASTFLNQERWKEDYSEFVDAKPGNKRNKAQQKQDGTIEQINNWEKTFCEESE